MTLKVIAAIHWEALQAVDETRSRFTIIAAARRHRRRRGNRRRRLSRRDPHDDITQGQWRDCAQRTPRSKRGHSAHGTACGCSPACSNATPNARCASRLQPHRARPDRDRRRRAASRPSARRDADPALRATLRVHDPRFYSDIAFGGSVGAGEAYMHGHWSVDDLTALTRILLRNRGVLDGMEDGWARLTAPLRRALHFAARNTRDGSRRNIAAHYDLGNEFFELFLDPMLMYSCAVLRSRARRDARSRPRSPSSTASAAGSSLQPGRPRAGDRHRLGRLRTARGAATTVAASPPPRSPRASTSVRRRGLPKPDWAERITLLHKDYRDFDRNVRQAGVDRDDRGGRTSVLTTRSLPGAAHCSNPKA